MNFRKFFLLEDIVGYNELLKAKEKLLAGTGRIFIRFSGTEPLIRILVEGNDKNLILQIAEEFASFLEKELK